MSRVRSFSKYHQSNTLFSRDIINTPLYPYQQPIADYIGGLVRRHDLENIVVEMSRQSGKNELSAHIEGAALAWFSQKGGNMVKAAPTWKPQIIRSKTRLALITSRIKQRLPLNFKPREGFMLTCHNAGISFLSGKPTANVVGDTANLLLEIDEAQDFDKDKYNKEFSPMRASTGAPAVFYGTTWTDVTLLEEIKINIQEGRTAGKIFRVPWEMAAEDNRLYGDFVQSEITRLGRDHPIIKTQYDLIPIEEAGYFLKPQLLKQIIGDHSRKERRSNEIHIVAGLDFAGADEETEDMISLANFSKRDSVALSIGELEYIEIADGVVLPSIRVLDRYEWVNVPPTSLHSTLYDILHHKWKVDLLHSDATGIGETGTHLLVKALNKHGQDRITPVKFDSAWNVHTRLAFQYLAIVLGSRLKDYTLNEDDPLTLAKQDIPPQRDNPHHHIWWQRGHARQETRPGKRVKVYVPENEGHDDLLVADMLMVDAAYKFEQKWRSIDFLKV